MSAVAVKIRAVGIEQIERAYRSALDKLLSDRHADGFWVGELSTSALSTATAVSALALMKNSSRGVPPGTGGLIERGVRWLTEHQNGDGGWGDTVKSFSNISTTMLCRAAFHLAGVPEHFAHCLVKADGWLTRYGKTAEELAEAIRSRYGKDRTFATPILTTCALAGLVSWQEVPPLPFEFACLPQSWFRFLRLHVVSYALPALIAIGQAIYHHRPPRNPLTRITRRLAQRRSLEVLKKIQPASGGFLEAVPLTSFVTLSLAACGLADHQVARNGMRFLIDSVRPDGSWPIDTNLATWVTTLALNALAAAGELERLESKDKLRDWLIRQQYTTIHPYTGAAPGGWAWTPLSGGVPDADDTAGALLALASLESVNATVVNFGLNWLVDLQNSDGGWPTFCRGWGHLPFDRSGCDLTAHVLRGMRKWTGRSLGEFNSSKERGLAYLAQTQRADGSWLPLWFGNQHAPDDENPTYGTARVLAAYRDLDKMNDEPARRGVAWLLAAQNGDGGWGGAAATPSSMEETALAVEVLLDVSEPSSSAQGAVNKGLAWLVEHVSSGGLEQPTAIGFYFAKLWYFEKLYPIIFTVAALGKARRKLTPVERH